VGDALKHLKDIDNYRRPTAHYYNAEYLGIYAAITASQWAKGYLFSGGQFSQSISTQ
jgi:hypothetical protein